MSKKVSVSNANARTVELMLQTADHAREAEDRVTTELMIALTYATCDAIYANSPLPDVPEVETPPYAASLPQEPPSDPHTTPKKIRKFWE